MKLKKFAYLAMAAAALLPSLSSCSSDPNPFDIHISSEKQTSTIQLRLNVEDTRAGNLSTDEENKITKVTIHVFDDKHNLEVTKNEVVTDASNNIVNLEVSNGLKTLYVVSAKSNVNPAKGMSLSAYENSSFNSSLENIKSTADGFVMVGKSNQQLVMSAASKDNLPQSNIFNVTLRRLVAKAQVKTIGLSGSSFGFIVTNASFRAFQLCQQMRVLNNGSDIFDTFVDSNNNGTCDNYSQGVGEYLNAVTTDFSAAGCAYMSENIVNKPLSGNTTFLGIRLQTTPNKNYTFDTTNAQLKASSGTPISLETYYAVGVHDKENGFVDYALAPNSKNILTFKDEEDAQNYVNSLNNGNSSTFTVSQTDKPMMAASVIKKANGVPQFEVFEFKNGYAYYRVNIAHEDNSSDTVKKIFMVQRNKFYKVNINSVGSLGFSKEEYLIPTKFTTVLDIEGHGWISANISVEEWDEVNQNVDL